jgi:hypothetical protein
LLFILVRPISPQEPLRTLAPLQTLVLLLLHLFLSLPLLFILHLALFQLLARAAVLPSQSQTLEQSIRTNYTDAGTVVLLKGPFLLKVRLQQADLEPIELDLNVAKGRMQAGLLSRRGVVDATS